MKREEDKGRKREEDKGRERKKERLETWKTVTAKCW